MKKSYFVVIFILCCVGIHAQDYKFVISSGDSIFYEVKGAGNGAVLFLAGGPGGSPESLKPIVDYVSEDYYTILLHQRGTGLSSNRTDSAVMTIDQHVDDISCILKQEKIDNIFIIGHSWGAMLALDYMVKKPDNVKGLVLIGSYGCSLDFMKEINNEIMKRITPEEMAEMKLYYEQLNSGKGDVTRKDYDDMVAELMISKQFYNPSLVREILKNGQMNMQVNNLIMGDLKKKKWNLQDDLKNSNCPVVIVNGDYDLVSRQIIENMKQSLKNSEFHIIENCGHYVWLEKPAELQSIIQKFLRSKILQD